MSEKPAAAPKQPLNVSSVLSGLIQVFKAIPDDKLEDIKNVTDIWNTPNGEHSVPSRAQVVTGPAEPMSGGGVPKMINEYSSPAPQDGLTRLYEQVCGLMADFRKSRDMHGKAISGILTVLESMQKAQEPVVVTEKSAPAEDSFLGKALKKIAKAKSELRKADLLDEDEAESRKSHLEAAKEALKSAQRALAKAEDNDEDEEAAEKAMSDLKTLRKAVAKAEEEEAEDEKAKAAAAALVAKSEDEKKEEEEAAEKARQAEEAAAKAKEAVTLAEQVTKALTGSQVAHTKLQEILNLIKGTPSASEAPAVAKADGGTVVVDIAGRVRDAIDGEMISDGSVSKASSLLQRYNLVQDGRYDSKAFADELSRAPLEVQSLFQVAA